MHGIGESLNFFKILNFSRCHYAWHREKFDFFKKYLKLFLMSLCRALGKVWFFSILNFFLRCYAWRREFSFKNPKTVENLSPLFLFFSFFLERLTPLRSTAAFHPSSVPLTVVSRRLPLADKCLFFSLFFFGLSLRKKKKLHGYVFFIVNAFFCVFFSLSLSFAATLPPSQSFPPHR